MHLVSFVDSFHRVHLVPGMRSRSPNFSKSSSWSLEPIRFFWIFVYICCIVVQLDCLCNIMHRYMYVCVYVCMYVCERLCCVEMGYDRYKFIVQVVIGEQRGEGVK